ncbi:MAG: hypothetical protein WA865_07095, partial [Spirulinaceae cyanobacterium]
KTVIDCFPKYTRLRIDRQKIQLNNKFPIPRKAIDKLEISKYWMQSKRRSYNRCNIKIWAGLHLLKIPTLHLREREVNWIANELSECLDLPITQ